MLLRRTWLKWVLTAVGFICAVLAVCLTVTNHRRWDALVTVQTCKLARLTALHRHCTSSRGRWRHTAGGHQLIYGRSEGTWSVLVHNERPEYFFAPVITCVKTTHLVPLDSYLLCNLGSQLANRRCVWTPPGWCAGSELWPAYQAIWSQGFSRPSAPQTPTSQMRSFQPEAELYLWYLITFFGQNHTNTHTP